MLKTVFFTGQCQEVCEIRKRLNSKIPVYADMMEVNSTYLGEKSKKETAVDIVKRAYANGVFASGKTTEESIVIGKEIKSALTDVPVFLGGGATGDNICDLIQIYDGVSVATWIKNGDMSNPIDLERAKYFLDELNKGRQLRKQ